MNVVPAFRMPNPVATGRAGAATVLLAILLGTGGLAFAQSTASDRLVATVNGTQVHESEMQVVDEIVGRNLTTQDKVERREIILKMIIDTILLSQVAKERKVVDEADLQRRATFARNQGLMNQLLSVVGQQAVSEQSIRRAYEEVVVKASNEPEMNLRHLFFLFKEAKDDAAMKEAEEKVNAAYKRIQSGEDFAAVAADVSEDTVTKAKGGDFQWRTTAEMGAEYAEAALKLKNGEVSPPIKTSVGWHLIKLEDRRIRKPLPLEKIKDRVAAMVAANAQFELVDKVRTEAKIELVDANKPTPGKETTSKGN